MDFKDIGTKELKELNLHPIMRFRSYKAKYDIGYYDVYVRKTDNGCFVRSKLPYLFGDKIVYTPPYRDGWILEKRVEMKNFLDMTESDFEFFGIEGKALNKMLWLQKYLKGEVDGVYTDDDFIRDKEIVQKDKIIASLRKELQKEKDKNTEMKEEIQSLKKELKDIEKIKLTMLAFIDESVDLLDKSRNKINNI